MNRLFPVAASLLFAMTWIDSASAELVAYWPFEDFDNELSTPDVVNQYDLEAWNMDDFNHVDGKIGKAFEFFNADQSILSRITEEDEKIPVNKHPEWTLSMWAKVKGTGQNDLRLFSEGSTNDNGPLFNIGTANNGNDDTLDIFIRNGGNTGHLRTNGTPFDDEWHHIGWTFSEGVHSIFLDGVLDRTVDWPSFADDDPFKLNTVSVGGIERAAQSHFVTGILDEVALWDEVLLPVSISGLASEILTPLNATDILLGDFNFDGAIDGGDYNLIVMNFRNSGTYADGDIDGNGVIDLHDFGGFLEAAAAVAGAAPQAVPEPGGGVLLFLGILFSGLLRSARRKLG